MRLSPIISDGLVLQRGKDNYIWGSECASGAVVEITLNGKCTEGNADADGNFKIKLPEVQAGGPYVLTIHESSHAFAEINNVMCGDVFLLAGQSNMEIPLQRCMDMYEEEIKSMDLPYIHYFEVAKECAFAGPVNELDKGQWLEATQENLYPMSALGVFFARLAHNDEHVPMGLIQTGVGGTHIESYLSEERVIDIGKFLRKEAIKRGEDISSCSCDKNDSCKVCYERILRQDKDSEWVAETQRNEAKAQADWYGELASRDKGLKAHWETKNTFAEEGEQAEYVYAPGRWERYDNEVWLDEANQSEEAQAMRVAIDKLEDFRGSIWLVKNVDIPKHWLDKEIRVYLGTLVDGDDTYVNGTLIGQTGYRYPPRRYRIPAGVLHEGSNSIVIRLVVCARSGGFVKEHPYYLSLGDERIALDGPWEYRIGGEMYDETPGCYTEAKDVTFFNWKPTAMYNKMVYPLRNLALKGILFYQGESNCTHAWEYEYLMIEMAECFRELFGEELPFGFVELPMFGGEDGSRGSYEWDDLRAAQERAAAKIPNSVIADIYDLGFKYELHPQTKKAAAERLYGLMKRLLY